MSLNHPTRKARLIQECAQKGAGTARPRFERILTENHWGQAVPTPFLNQPTGKETLSLRIGEVIPHVQPRCPALTRFLRATPTTPV